MACCHFERLAADGCSCKIESYAADQHERVLWLSSFWRPNVHYNVGMPHVFFALVVVTCINNTSMTLEWYSFLHLPIGEERCCFPPSPSSPLSSLVWSGAAFFGVVLHKIFLLWSGAVLSVLFLGGAAFLPCFFGAAFVLSFFGMVLPPSSSFG